PLLNEETAAASAREEKLERERKEKERFEKALGKNHCSCANGLAVQDETRCSGEPTELCA
ncbi:unnamed protein product, partial [Amoebophrya sp. A120]